jgi:hypothetical protein
MYSICEIVKVLLIPQKGWVRNTQIHKFEITNPQITIKNGSNRKIRRVPHPQII